MIKIDKLISLYDLSLYEASKDETIQLLAANIRAYKKSLDTATLKLTIAEKGDSKRFIEILDDLEQSGINHNNAVYDIYFGVENEEEIS